MRIIKIVLVLVLIQLQLSAQTSIKILTQKEGVSLRGLSIPSEKVIWASGSKGTVVKSVNGGESFEWLQVKGYETRDFRAIHAWDEREVLIVAIASPAVILKTNDGGVNWHSVYENTDTSMFLDAVKFKNDNVGTVIGDPINDTLFFLKTQDRGEHWTKEKPTYWKSKLNKGEAFFASSNSNITYDFQHTFFVTGGIKSRLWMDGFAMEIPMIQGFSSTGANSISISPNMNKLIIAGGDFSKPSEVNQNLIRLDRFKVPNTENKHLSKTAYVWKVNNKVKHLNGYKSSILFMNNKTILAAGTSGVDISVNSGRSWKTISNQSFHVVQKTPHKNAAIFAGSGGRIGYLSFE